MTTVTKVKQTGAAAVNRTVTAKLNERVSVFDYMSAAEITTVKNRTRLLNVTTAINAAIAANPKKNIHFPAGDYLYSGGMVLGDNTTISGDGRTTSVLISTLATPTGGSLVNCSGYGSGIRSMGFNAIVTQTGGAYVLLNGPESYITDFFMDYDFQGIIMNGNVSQIHNGRMQTGSPGAIRITSGGGDNSQSISNVLMGAQTPANSGVAGIRLRNSVALTIHNVSVIQQGAGILIDPTSSAENVLSLFCSQCFFDNCTAPIRIEPTGGAAVNRCYFTDVWASSGVNGVTIVGSGGTVKGIHFTGLQSNLNVGSAVTTGANVSQLYFDNCTMSGNGYGMYLNQPINGLVVSNSRIGNFDDFSNNTNQAIVFAAGGFSNVQITGNNFTGNSAAIAGAGNLGSLSRIEGNIAYNPVGGSAMTVGASPYTYTAGPSPETVYVAGGTVSNLVHNGVVVFTATDKTINLGPNETLQVIYTVAPFMNKVIH